MEFPIKTDALVTEAPGSGYKMMPVFIDELRPNEVLVEMRYSGLCHTDLLAQGGSLPILKFPAILGHEGAGVILALGSSVTNSALKVGDHVLLSFTVCRDCHPCREQRVAKCVAVPLLNLRATRVLDDSTSARFSDGTGVRAQFFGQSSFSKISAVHEQCVVKCPDSAIENLALYAPMGCGFQTGAGTILNILKPKPYHSLVIFGLGSVGFTVLMAAVLLGVEKIIAIDIVDEKLRIAQELGATDIFNSSGLGDVVVEKVRQWTGRGADYAVDTTGVPQVVEQLADCLGQGGTAALIGGPPIESKIELNLGSFFYESKNLISVIEGDSYPPEFIPKLIDLHQRGKFPIDKICKVYAAEEIDKAISDMKEGKVIKPVLRLD